jgi:hypothetical protein
MDVIKISWCKYTQYMVVKILSPLLDANGPYIVIYGLQC